MGKKNWIYRLFFLAFPSVLILSYSFTAMDPSLMPRFTILCFSSVIIGIISIFLLKKTDWNISWAFIKSKAFFPFWIFLATALLSLFVAVNRVEAYWIISRDFFLFSLMLVLPAIFNFFKSWKTDFLKGFVIAIWLAMLIGFFQLNQEIKLHGAEILDLYQLKSSFSHRNLWAGFLVLSLPFLVQSIYLRSRFWTLFSALVLVVSLFWIYFLESRSAWIALLVFALSYFGILGIQKTKFRLSSLFNKVSASIVFLTFGLGFVVFYYSAEDNLQSQELAFNLELKSETEKTFTVEERVLMWKGSGLMIQDNGLLGVGMGNWKIQFPKYGSDIWRARQGLVQFQRPHNDFLWVLSEQGIVGLMAFLFMFFSIIFMGLKNTENSILSNAERRFNRLLIAGIIAFLAISFFSFPRERIAHQWILIISFSIIGFYYFKFSNIKIKNLKIYQLIPLAFCVLGLMGFTIGLQRWKGEIYTKSLLSYKSANQWWQMSEVSEKIEDYSFYDLDPSSVPISFYKGLAKLNMGQEEEALQLFLEAESKHPNMIHVINNIASVYQLKKDFDHAIIYYQKALKISPKYQDGILNLSSAYFNSNQVMKAYDLLLSRQSSFPKNDERYSAYVLFLLNIVQENIADSIKEEELKNALLELNDEWLLQIHQKVQLDSIKVEQRMIMDAIYGMEVIQSKISTKQADEYRNLYLNNFSKDLK